MLNNKAMANRMEQLLAQGKTMEEALAEVLIQVSGQQTIMSTEERLTHIDAINTIPEIKKAIKSAAGKKSKAKKKGQDEKIAKYDHEYNVAYKRYNTMVTDIETSEDRVLKAMEYGVAIADCMKYLVEDMEYELNCKLDDLHKNGMTRKEIKLGYRAASMETPQVVVDMFNKYGSNELMDAWNTRVLSTDQRIIAICQKYNYVNSLSK